MSQWYKQFTIYLGICPVGTRFNETVQILCNIFFVILEKKTLLGIVHFRQTCNIGLNDVKNGKKNQTNAHMHVQLYYTFLPYMYMFLHVVYMIFSFLVPFLKW